MMNGQFETWLAEWKTHLEVVNASSAGGGSLVNVEGELSGDGEAERPPAPEHTPFH